MKYVYFFILALPMLLTTGCETFETTSSRNRDDTIRDLQASSKENFQAFANQSAAMNNKLAAMQEDYAKVIGKVNSLQRQMNYLNQQNQTLAKRINVLSSQIAAAQQQNQENMQKIINVVAEQTARAVKSATPQPKSTTRSRSAAGPVGSGKFYKYKVQPGATLIAIAKAYKVSVEDIKRANNLKSNMIFSGQILYIPKKN